MKNRTLKLFSDKNKGKLKKGLVMGLGAGAGLGTALGGSYLINKEASDKLAGVDDSIKSMEGLTDSQRINMQKKLNELSDTYRNSNAVYDRTLGNTELERKLLENQFKTKAISQEEYNKRLGDLFLKDNQAKIDHQINPENQMKAIRDIYNNPNDYKAPVTIKDKLADFLGKYGENDKLGFGNYEGFSNKKKDELNKPINNFSSSISPIYFAEAALSPSEKRNKAYDAELSRAKASTEKEGGDWAKKAATMAVKGTNLIKNSGSIIKGVAGAARNSVADKINSVRHSIGATKDKMVNGVKNFFTGNKHSDAVSKDKALQKANASLDKRAKTANALANQKKPGFWESTKRLVSAGANSSNNDLVVQERNNQRRTVQERAQGRKSGRDYNNLKQKNMRKAEKAAAYNAKASKIKNSYQSFFFSDGTPNRFALTNFAMNNPVFELEAQLIDSWNRDYDLQQTFSDYYEFEEYFITNFSDLDYYSDYLSQFEPVIDYAASMTTMTNNTYFNFSNQVLNDMRDCLILFANKDTQFTANKNKGVGTDNYGHGLYGKHNSGIHFAPETQQKIQEEGQRYFSRWSSAYVNAIGNSLGLNEQSPIQFQANSGERMQEFLNPSSNFSAKDVALSTLIPAGVAFGGTSLINAIDGQDRFDPAVSAALSGGLGLTAGIAREISNRDAERLTLQRLKEALDEKNQDKRK